VATDISTLVPISSLTEKGWPITLSASSSHSPAISPSGDGSNSPSRSTGLVIGAAVGSAVAGACISALLIWCISRRRQDHLNAPLMDSDESYPKWVDPSGGAGSLW
jgi:hypothetical protein